MEFLGREGGILFDRVKVGPELVQLVAPVLNEVERVGLGVPVEGDGVPDAGRISRAVAERLTGLVGREAPDAGVLLQQVAG